ncbi:hypothetical protein Daus18300_003776 [Diaporthe australafricana]|uniref:Kinetochore protein mis14 n=1 Tax=Diaporthe australafricana TaxID=127596 RepID=A0ABR3XE46_9PEZI
MNKPARRRSSYKNIQEEGQQQSQQTNATSSFSAPHSSNNNGNVMDGAHRKIELQSPEDLTFLINNVRRAAEEHINAAFPPVDGQDDAGAGEDELRVRIEKLVADYISQTFTLAAPNLSINGFDLDAKTFPAVYLASPASPPSSSGRTLRTRRQPVVEEEVRYEAFDGRKRARVEELAREEEDLMREIAALKRRVPAATAAGYADAFWEGVRADEEALGRAREAIAAGALDGGPDENGGDDGKQDGEEDNEEDGAKKNKKVRAVLDGLGPLERQAGVEASYESVIEMLSRLKREMPATVAKMERARVAGEYVVTER